jgi:hypothetical protein
MRMGLQFVLIYPAVFQRVCPARLAALLELFIPMIQCKYPNTREVALQQRLHRRQHLRVWGIRPRVVVDHELPFHRLIWGIIREIPPAARRTRVELAAVAHRLAAVRVQRVFARKVDQERRARLREAPRVVFGGDDVRVHRGLHAVRERAAVAAVAAGAAVQQFHDVRRVVDDPEPIRRSARVEHPVARLNPTAHGYARRALEDALCGFVISVPMLVHVTKDLRDAHNEHLPRGIEARVIDIGKCTDRRREMPREADRPVEEIWIGSRIFVLCRRTFDLEMRIMR